MAEAHTADVVGIQSQHGTKSAVKVAKKCANVPSFPNNMNEKKKKVST